MKTALREKEQTFCRLMTQGLSATEAAARAGYRMHPMRTADRLLARKDIRKAIEDADTSVRRDAASGYGRIAFGGVADAIRLCFAEGVPDNLDEMDLFAVSEIKCSKNGVEIKFHDRLKALDRLCDLTAPGENRAEPFYRALELSARRLNTEE